MLQYEVNHNCIKWENRMNDIKQILFDIGSKLVAEAESNAVKKATDYYGCMCLNYLFNQSN